MQVEVWQEILVSVWKHRHLKNAKTGFYNQEPVFIVS